MKPRVVFVALTIFVSQANLAQAGKIPAIEQGIYQSAPPFENIKQSFYVRERERPLLDLITDASTSLARFLIGSHNMSSAKPASAMPHVLADAQGGLRLPPMATTGGNGRYVGLVVYCWKSKEKDHLEFLIEWADITTNARYTDSYVFVRRGPSWYFEKHGSIPPWHWTQTEPYFQRTCPSIINE
jgi:hypothetical protein